LEIANNNDISEDFILMADDIYILKKNEKIGYYKIGSLKSFLGAAKNRNSLHYKSIKAVYDLYSE
jgi:hypothetical protein